MDITPEELYSLFTLLRSSNPAENQAANNQLQELIKYPNTIFASFTLLDDTSDETIRRHAYYLLANCFRNSKSKIEDDFLIQCREQIIHLLQNETNLFCIEAIVIVIQILIDPRIPWPEIEQFAFSINYNESPKNLFLAISIFNGLIGSFTPEFIFENQEGMIDLALSGLNFDTSNKQIICLAVTFLHDMFIAFQANFPDQMPDSTPFQEKLLEIFFQSIESSDIYYIIQIISPIINGYKNNIFLFKAIEALPNILQILQSDQLDTILRLTVHDFFVITFLNSYYSDELDKEDWGLIIEIESYITNIIVSSSDELDATMWFDDVLKGLSIFYMKMESEDAVSFTISQGQELLTDINASDSNSISSACFAMLLFCTCVAYFQDGLSDEQIDYIYQAFLDALNSHIPILMNVSGGYLIELFKNFEKIVNDNYIESTFRSILAYLVEETKDDILLLYAFVKILDNSDPIFSNLIEICFQLINNGSAFVQQIAYFIIGECIDHSNSAAYELFDPLYLHFIEIIKNPQVLIQMPHYFTLICLNSLINVSPEKVEPLVDEFFTPILSVFHNSNDPVLIQYILDIIDSISTNKILSKSLDPQYFEFIVEEFPRIIEKDWKTKIENSIPVDTKYQKVIHKFLNASHALEILARFTTEYKQYTVEYLLMKYMIIFFQALKSINEPINEVTEFIFNALRLIIGNPKFFERGGRIQQDEADLQQLKEQLQNNPDDNLSEIFEGKKTLYDYYLQEIQICKLLFIDIIEILQTTNDENITCYLLNEIKFLIENKCVDVDQFEIIINSALNSIKNLNNSSICLNQFGHVICEISKYVDFDNVCELIIPFIKQMLDNDDNLKTTIDAIIFIRNTDDFSFLFLQRPEMSDFWQSIPDLIADSSNDEELTTAVIKLMSTVCLKTKQDQTIQIASTLLESAKKRLMEEIEQPSKLRDNLAAFLSILGAYVIGDHFPFDEIIPLILSVIPLDYDFTLCTELYQFISGIYMVVIDIDDEMKNLYVRGIIDLFAQPYRKIKAMGIDSYVLKSLQKSLTDALQIDEDDDGEKFMESVLDILGGNQEKYSLFVQSFTRIHFICEANQWANS